MMAQLDPTTIADWTRRSRAASGLPATITDGAVLAKIVTLALAGTDQAEPSGRAGRGPGKRRGRLPRPAPAAL